LKAFEPILKPGRNCMEIVPVDESGVLIDGRDYYMAFYKAARTAKKYILIAGWQFDSDTRVIRGKDAVPGREYRFLPFLNEICSKNPDLQIYILAWDFSVIFTLEREWFQKYVFEWSACPKISFRFDSTNAIGGSHHQKFLVIDGKLAFAGGMDICANRWDDRRHAPHNPERIEPADEFYGPYHEVQAYMTGPIAAKLERLFKERWVASGGEEISLPAVPDSPGYAALNFKPTVPIYSNRAAISRIQPRTLSVREPVYEIRHLYRDSIRAARELVYIENQYFTSKEVYLALAERMREKGLPPLQIIILLPHKPEAFVEEFGLGNSQAKLLSSLCEIAAETGHSFGVFYSTHLDEKGKEAPTYIHSKLFIVDDRFLSVGSANTTNRSLGIDTELNISWEALSDGDGALIKSIRRVRVSLMAESTGLWDAQARKQFRNIKGLAAFLGELADNGSCLLRRVEFKSIFDGNRLLHAIKTEKPIFDPDKALIEESLYELISGHKNGLFAKGISLLHALLKGKKNANTQS